MTADELTVLGERFAHAVAYAADLHRDQRRKASAIPYVAHLLAAASLVLEQGGDEDEAIAALLHDALEDQAHRTSEAEIGKRFGAKVAAIVLACSDSTGAGEKAPWEQRKREYLAHLREQPPDVLRVSLADKLHNARSIVTDLRSEGSGVWDRFNAGPAQQRWYYESLLQVFRERHGGRLVDELAVVVEELAASAARAPARSGGEVERGAR